jgi:2-(1,2-epoxy-1,2-dihydrophenyl)acetyl-CoA isomerase
MSYGNILFEIAGGIARLTLNRPERLNSFNDAMHAEVRDAVGRVRADPSVRVLLLTGAGRGFCAGQDLGDRAVAPGAEPVDLGASIDRNYKPLVLALRALPLPVVCAVNGVAAGAGASIALACDIVIAAKSASFVQAFSKIGLIPDSGGTYLLPRLIGTARAMGLAVFGDKLPAEQAASWGLIWRCVDDAELPATVDAILKQLASAPTRGLAAAKQALYAAAGNTLEAQLDLERDLQRELGTSADYGRASSCRYSRRGAGAGRARGFGDVYARRGFAGAGHAGRARRRRPRRALDARACGYAQRPPHLSRRVYFPAGRQRVRVCLQQLQFGDGSIRLHDRVRCTGARGRRAGRGSARA